MRSTTRRPLAKTRFSPARVECGRYDEVSRELAKQYVDWFHPRILVPLGERNSLGGAVLGVSPNAAGLAVVASWIGDLAKKASSQSTPIASRRFIG